MDEPAKFFGRPVVWVESLGVEPLTVLGHSPLCQCEPCRLKESARLGSADNPMVIKPEPPRS